MTLKQIALFVGLCLSLNGFAQDQSCSASLAPRPSFVRRVLHFLFGAPESQPVPAPGTGAGAGGSADAPKMSHQYQSQNFETDTPPGNEPVVVHYSFNQPHAEYFELQRFKSVDAASGIVYSPPSPTLNAINSDPPSTSLVMEVNAKALTTTKDWNWLLRPFGYAAVGYATADVLTLAGSDEYLAYQQLHQAKSTLFVSLQPAPAQTLSPIQRSELTTVNNAPELFDYPPKIIEYVQGLQRTRRQRALTDITVARALASFIQQSFKYEVHVSPARGVLEFCAREALQCSPATVVWMVLLRSFFKIPCYAVAGYRSSADQSDAAASVVLNKSTPHMFGAAYDDTIHRFIVVDPTPGEANERKEHEGQSDPRFTEWPKPNLPPNPALDSQEADESESPGRAGSPVEQKPNIDWAEVFDNVSTPNWRAGLKKIKNQLELARTQTGLSPTDENVFNDVAYADTLASFLPTTPLLELARDLSRTPSAPDQIKRDHLKMQLLLRLASYGQAHARDSELWSEVFTKVRALSEAMPRTRALTSNAEFSATLPGDFSRALFAEQPMKLNALRQLVRTRELVDFSSLKNSRFVPKEKFDRTFTPTDDEHTDLVEAEDFEHYAKFEREGYPPSMDAMRVAREEMMIPRYREPTLGRRNTPRKPKDGPSLTYILGDLSGSMRNNSRGVVRDRITALWIDELMSENSASSIKYYGYRDKPEAPISWSDLKTSRNQFFNMLAQGEYFTSNLGNDLVAAFNLVATDALKLGQKFERINFRILTDGQEGFDFKTLAEIRDKLGQNKQISLDVVTIEEGNDDLRKFVAQSKASKIIDKGQFVHLKAEAIKYIIGSPQADLTADMDWYLPENYLDYQRIPDHLRRSLRTVDQPRSPSSPRH